MTTILSTLEKIKNYILKHKLLAIVIIVGLIVLGFFLSRSDTPDLFEYTTVKSTTFRTYVEGSGSISTESQVSLRSKVSGQVVSVLVSSGQEVQEGQPLIQIDSTTASQNLQRAKLALERQKALILVQEARVSDTLSGRLDGLATSYDEGLAVLSSVATSMTDIQSTLELLFSCNGGFLTTCRGYNPRDPRAQQKLTAEGFWWEAQHLLKDEFMPSYVKISSSLEREEIEESLSLAYEVATAVAEAAKAAQDVVVYERDRVDWLEVGRKKEADEAYSIVVKEMSKANQIIKSVRDAYDKITGSIRALHGAEIDVQDLEYGSSLLDLKERELAVEDAEIELAKYTIRAPFKGTIGSVNIAPHDWINNNTAVSTLSTKKHTAQISLNEVDVTQVDIGQKAELTFDALPDIILIGTVSEIDPVGIQSSSVVSFNVKITLDETDERVLPGMNVTANIITLEKKDVLTVPNTSIRNQNGLSYVEVFNKETAENDQVEVELGAFNEVETEILSGLVEGAEIILRQLSNTPSTTQRKEIIFGHSN